MPTNFTGTPTWRETIAGPANADEVTGPSVSDMGVLLSDRGQWQKQGTIGYADERTNGFSVSATTDDTPIYTSRFELEVALSRVLVTQSLPRVLVEDGDCTVEPVLYDDTDTIVEVASSIALLQDDALPQLVLVAGYDEVPAGSYSFGLRVTCAGAAKFLMGNGNVRTIAQAYPLVGA
jgi:hypothetical protein